MIAVSNILAFVWAILITVFWTIGIPIILYFVCVIFLGLLLTEKEINKISNNELTIWWFFGSWWVYLFVIRDSFPFVDSFPL